MVLGVKAKIVMPKTTPLIKVEGTKKYDAEVILYGDCYSRNSNPGTWPMLTTSLTLLSSGEWWQNPTASTPSVFSTGKLSPVSMLFKLHRRS